MRTDYKFWYIKRNDAGVISECAIRFFEGDITTENEYNLTADAIIPTTRYRRTKKLKKNDLKHLKSKKIKKDKKNNDAVLYTPTDFGVISTDDQLRTFLNGEIIKDINREPIDEQK